jgi:endonuclease/exonuclease/phosphatase family metal-dependent hydrolase
MKRVLRIAGWALLSLLVLVAAIFFWASSGRLSASERAQRKTYEAAASGPADRDTFTVMTYNIGYLSGMTNNEPVERDPSLFRENMDQAAALIRRVDPDFIGLQEIDFGAQRSQNVHQLDTLATRLGYPAAAQAVNWDKRYLPFPYWPPSVHFGDVLSGQAVLSRYPIRSHQRVELQRPPRPFWSDAFYLDRLAQVSIVDIGGWPLVIINVHLEAFDEATREEQARQIRTLYNHYEAKQVPILLIGDFNSMRPGDRSMVPPGQRPALTSDETMNIIMDELNLDTAVPESAVLTAGIRGTYPADDPKYKIDHIFYRRDRIKKTSAKIWCGAPSPPSDHCAVSLSFRLPRPPDPSTTFPFPDDAFETVPNPLASDGE